MTAEAQSRISDPKTSVVLVPYDDKNLNAALAFLTEFSPDHPELGSKELFLWQKCRRHLAFFKNKIIGHMAIIEHPFKFNDAPLRIGWGSALVIDDANFALKTFAGVALLDRCFDDSSYIYTGVGIVPEIEQSYIRRGYVICSNSVKMYARFFNPVKALRYFNKPGIFSFPMKAVNLIKPARNAGSDEIIYGRIHFDSDLDSVWERILAARYEMYGARTASFLNYKISQPGKEYSLLFHKDGAGEIDGYLLYRRARHNSRDLDIIRICDMVGVPEANLALISEAIRAAHKLNVDGIVALGSPKDRAIFKNAGMWLTKRFPVGLKPEFAGKMHLTFFDSDLDNLW